MTTTRSMRAMPGYAVRLMAWKVPRKGPSLGALLPEVRGRRVVDLGCSHCWFCRWAHDQGAVKVLGLDVSEKVLVQAKGPRPTQRSPTSEPTWKARTAGGPFDLAYSSLA